MSEQRHDIKALFQRLGVEDQHYHDYRTEAEKQREADSRARWPLLAQLVRMHGGRPEVLEPPPARASEVEHEADGGTVIRPRRQVDGEESRHAGFWQPARQAREAAPKTPAAPAAESDRAAEPPPAGSGWWGRFDSTSEPAPPQGVAKPQAPGRDEGAPEPAPDTGASARPEKEMPRRAQDSGQAADKEKTGMADVFQRLRSKAPANPEPAQDDSPLSTLARRLGGGADEAPPDGSRSASDTDSDRDRR